MNKAKITVFTSASGGVGKTTLAMNAAYSLYKSDRRVLLLDLSIYGGIDIVLRKNKKMGGLTTLYSSYEQGKDLEITPNIIESDHAFGFDVILNSSPLTMEKMDMDFIDKLFAEISLKQYDEIIVDTSMELSPRLCRLLQVADRLIYVVTQDIATCFSTMKHMEVLEKLHISNHKVAIALNKFRKDIPFNIAEFESIIDNKISTIFNDYKGEMTVLHNEGELVLKQNISRYKKHFLKSMSQLLEEK
jgi:pilus assembly protein CpaE